MGQTKRKERNLKRKKKNKKKTRKHTQKRNISMRIPTAR